MSAKKNKKVSEPTWAGIILIGICMAVLGALGAFAFLVSFPAKTFSSLNDRRAYEESTDLSQPKPGDAFLYVGGEDRGTGWQAKRESFLAASGVVEITAAELNAWMRSVFRPQPAPKGDDAPKVLIIPGVPNFFVANGETLYLSLPTELSFFGVNRKYTMFAKGHLASGPDAEFVVDACYLNSARIPEQAGLAKRVIGNLMQAFSGSEEYAEIREAWAQVESVELVDNGMRLRFAD